MNKTPLQLMMSALMLSSFVLGTYVLYIIFLQIISLYDAGGLLLNVNTLFIITAFALLSTLTFLMLISAIKIFRNSNYRLMKFLLYISIPSLYIMNYLTYKFIFGPSFIIAFGVEFEPFSILLDFNFQLFYSQYNLAFSTTGQGPISIGINLVPIIILMILKKWAQPQQD